jgi:hypothetical protein
MNEVSIDDDDENNSDGENDEDRRKGVIGRTKAVDTEMQLLKDKYIIERKIKAPTLRKIGRYWQWSRFIVKLPNCYIPLCL